MSLERLIRRFSGMPVCAFDWPTTVPGARKTCDGAVIGERDGKPCCAAHLTTYVPKPNRPYDSEP